MQLRTLLQIVATVAASALLSLLLLTSSLAQDIVQASKRNEIATSPAAPSPVRKPVTKPTGVPSSIKRRSARIAAVMGPEPASSLLAITNQEKFSDRHQELASNVLRTLPPQCRTYLKNFYILYNGSSQRGLGGKTTIILDGSVSDEEFVGLLIHECGHVTHGNILGSRTTGASAFRDGQDVFFADSPAVKFFEISWMTERVLKEDAQKTDFVSGYAKSDAFEDFAETFAAYVLHRDMLRERAKTSPSIAAKLRWMQTYLPLPENSLGQSTYTWEGSVPWDMTKLPVTLASL